MKFIFGKFAANTTFELRLMQNDALVNITGAEITANFYQKRGALQFTKKNTAAGGGDDEVEIVNAQEGHYKVKIVAANVADWTDIEYECVVTFVIGATTYTQRFDVSITRNRFLSGTNEERPYLEADDVGYQYYDTDDETPYFWSGTGWT